MIKGVLFDMDGVLIDSEYYTAEASIRFFAAKGFTLTQEDFYPFYGTGEKGYFLGVAKKYGIPFDIEKDKIKVYDIFREMAKGKINALPGVYTFINWCTKKNIPLAVATSAGKYKMNINLELIGLDNNVFSALICGEDISNNKPDPEIFLTAASKLQLHPSQCLVIEDAPSGVEAAKAAGCLCLALQTTFEKKALQKADWITKNLSTLPSELKNLLSFN